MSLPQKNKIDFFENFIKISVEEKQSWWAVGRMRKSVILTLFPNEIDRPTLHDIAEDYGFFVTIDHILKFNPDFRWDVEALN
jgi:hypothetical protein